MAKLTKRNIEGLRKQAIADLKARGAREAILWDEELAGLGLRVGASGVASWLVYKRLGSGGKGAKQIRTVIGTYGEIPDPEKARDKARPIIEDIRNGTDPNARKRQARFTEAIQFRDGKLKDLWEAWLTKSRARGKTKRIKSSDYWYGVERLGLTEILPVLGPDTLIHTITKSQVRKLIEDKEAKSPSVARMIFACLRPFFLWCVEREAITVSPMAELSQPEKVKARDRTLSDDELVTVWSAASSLSYPWGPFYKLALLTAQRRDEVASIEWSEINFKKREWKIPGSKTKNGKEHLAHLSSWAIDILNSLKSKGGKRYVFTTLSRRDDKGELEEIAISGFSKARRLLDKEIKKHNNNKDLPRFTVHDLRRTAATGMASLKVPPHIVERILNHITGKDVGGLVGVYQHFEYVEERRQALTDWSNHINSLVLAQLKQEREANENILRFKVE
jgi:integrase